MHKNKVVSHLVKKSDLSERDIEAIAKTINPLVADCFALYVKTKNFHWHMTGPHFRDYHLLLDEHAEQILGMVDVLAERIRKLGKTTIRSIGQIQALQHIDDNADVNLGAEEMLRCLLADNQHLVSHMRKSHDICSEANDSATTSLLENFIDEAERRVWFLRQCLA